MVSFRSPDAGRSSRARFQTAREPGGVKRLVELMAEGAEPFAAFSANFVPTLADLDEVIYVEDSGEGEAENAIELNEADGRVVGGSVESRPASHWKNVDDSEALNLNARQRDHENEVEVGPRPLVDLRDHHRGGPVLADCQ